MSNNSERVRHVEIAPEVLTRFPYLCSDDRLKLFGKKITFIRHAESIYQTSELSYGEKCVNTSFRDAKLTEKGRVQGFRLAATLDREIGINEVELVVSSELSRCMQTAALAFGSRSSRVINTNPCFGEKVDSWSDVERGLDECLEDHVELRGFQWHRTRSRRCVQPNGDPLPQRWTLDKGYPFERESTAMDRVRRCWEWLADRKETNIVLFTHSKLLGREGESYGLLHIQPTEDMKKFENVEMAIVTFSTGEPILALPPAPPIHPTPSRHALVVLGMALNVDGSPSEVLKDRIFATVNNLEEHRKAAVTSNSYLLPRIILSGGDAAKVGISEARVMKRMLLDAGVPEILIIEEDQSVNSCQNAWYTGGILQRLGCSGVSLITSDYHMPRSLYIFEAVFKHLGLYHIDIAPISAESVCAMPANRLTKMYIYHIRTCITWEKHAMLERVDKEFLYRHIPNIHIAPLGGDRLERAISDIELMLLLYDKKYNL